MRTFAESKNKKTQIPIVVDLKPCQIFDYDQFYTPHINPTLCYYSKPHQFRFKKIEGQILCHYKMWAADMEYLPKSGDTVVTEPNLHAAPPQTSQSKSKLVRGTGKPKAKKAKLTLSEDQNTDTSEADEYADLIENEHEIFLDDHVASNEHLLPHTRGIVWLRTCAKEGSVPDRVFFNEEKKSKCYNYDNASSMLKYIVGKCAPLHPSIFSDVVLENWNGWFREQTLMWTRTQEYLLLLPPFIWPSSKQAQHCSNPLPTIEPSERPDPAPGMQIIVHDSGIHGEFSKRQLVEMKRKQCLDKEAISVQDVVAEKGCIFRWVRRRLCQLQGIPLGWNCAFY